MCIFLYVRITLMVVANIRWGAALPSHSAYSIQSTHELDVANSSSTFAGHGADASWVLPPSFLLKCTSPSVDRSPEFGFFICECHVIGINTDFYNFMNEPQTQQVCRDALVFLKGKYPIRMAWTTRLCIILSLS
ncbi:hypothetical protein BD769DRAFT_1519128 [Suillus cothurnatus]|nr:hypothetical protein BD769DRAFT_1519128 [Suillus cothurnatus]